MKNNIPVELTKTINSLAKLPGVGRVSAKRAVLHMLQDKTLIANLVENLNLLDQNISTCEICGNIATSKICDICADPERDSNSICVVEGVSQLWAMDSSESYNGKYFVLDGLLNALEGKGPDEIGISKLVDLVQQNNITEVILAVSASVDGQTTTHVIAESLQMCDNLKITSLAKGIPVGAGLDYMDSGTLFLALKNRNSL